MPELTEACFLSDPEGGDARIYRTGDLGCMLPDGCLVHRGRKNSHVKIRGYSVEISEVEAALGDVDGVKEAVVTTKDNTQGNQVLVAYVVPTGKVSLSVAAVRKAAAAKLPDYMIPSAFVLLDSLPLAGPGKVNLTALPELGRGRPELETPFALARTPVEQEIAHIWAELLGFEQIGIDDDFFQLGGDSLLASRVISRVIDAFRINVPLRALFEAPTVSAMASLVAQNGTKPAEPQLVELMLAEVEKLSQTQAALLLSKTKP